MRAVGRFHDVCTQRPQSSYDQANDVLVSLAVYGLSMRKTGLRAAYLCMLLDAYTASSSHRRCTMRGIQRQTCGAERAKPAHVRVSERRHRAARQTLRAASTPVLCLRFLAPISDRKTPPSMLDP